MRVKAVVAYDGGGFSGFASSAGVRTVMGELVPVLSMIARQPVKLVGAGRTDSGVHARGQVLSFDLPDTVDLAALVRSVNKLLGPAIIMRSIEPTSPEFNARFDAQWRRYRYTVLNSAVSDPFLAATAWHVPQTLQLDLMRLACDPLIGEHDFSSFCRKIKEKPEASMVRRVIEAQWSRPSPEIFEFEIRATAFCRQMVRSVVGLLVDVGRGRRTAGEVTEVLRDQNRTAAGTVAPPQGLCLEEVGYGGPGQTRPRNRVVLRRPER
ncbi:MAG: tRNA pseudouridine(38-40) synthase [Acidimicrobiia bacterium]|nr:tRNA pseudouridine(38-40) synthase [Acidimicrobiia bacterium]